MSELGMVSIPERLAKSLAQIHGEIDAKITAEQPVDWWESSLHRLRFDLAEIKRILEDAGITLTKEKR